MNLIFSRDKSKIAFIRYGYPSMDSVFTCSADGSDCQLMGMIRKSYTWLNEWSPDGTRIACVQNDLIAIFSADGLTLLGKGYDPCWSSDGTQLFYFFENGLWSITLSDNSVRKLADLQNHINWHLWAPDKSKLVYQAYSDASRSMVIICMKLDGSEPVTLPCHFTDSYTEVAGCWSSDSKKIALEYWNYVNKGEVITVMNPDGSDPISLITNQAIPFESGIATIDWFY